MQVTNNNGANGYQAVANTAAPTTASASTTKTEETTATASEQDTVTISPEAKALLASGIAQSQGGDLPDWPPIIEK